MFNIVSIQYSLLFEWVTQKIQTITTNQTDPENHITIRFPPDLFIFYTKNETIESESLCLSIQNKINTIRRIQSSIYYTTNRHFNQIVLSR